MKLSNFEVERIVDKNFGKEIIAWVDVTTLVKRETLVYAPPRKFLFWTFTPAPTLVETQEEVVERRMIRREPFGVFWHFVDTGDFTPDSQAEKLWRSWDAKQTLAYHPKAINAKNHL